MQILFIDVNIDLILLIMIFIYLDHNQESIKLQRINTSIKVMLKVD
jgi:hypothetical protein